MPFKFSSPGCCCPSPTDPPPVAVVTCGDNLGDPAFALSPCDVEQSPEFVQLSLAGVLSGTGGATRRCTNPEIFNVDVLLAIDTLLEPTHCVWTHYVETGGAACSQGRISDGLAFRLRWAPAGLAGHFSLNLNVFAKGKLAGGGPTDETFSDGVTFNFGGVAWTPQNCVEVMHGLVFNSFSGLNGTFYYDFSGASATLSIPGV